MEVQSALICIPDIKGFTEFMSETDLELSAKVIPSLLNEIIYANILGMKVSEIEGDAVLFYRTGEIPPFDDLVDQCHKFYLQFYERIYKLTDHYKHHGKSDKIPDILGLKIILHYGEIGINQIGKNMKLIGEDVIVAHRLLKNSVAFDEYILFSEQLISQYNGQRKQISEKYMVNAGYDDYDHIGKVNYHFMNLGKLVKQ